MCFTAHFFKYPVDLLQLKMAELGFERTNHFKAHRRTEKPEGGTYPCSLGDDHPVNA